MYNTITLFIHILKHVKRVNFFYFLILAWYELKLVFTFAFTTLHWLSVGQQFIDNQFGCEIQCQRKMKAVLK